MLKDILQVEDHNRVVGILFACLFGAIGKYEYRKLIGDKETQERVWAATESNGYILLNCKLYAYAYYVNRKLGIPTSPAKFGIFPEDVGVLRRLNLSHLDPRVFGAYTVSEFRAMESTIFTQDLMNYIGRFVTKKLRFLESYGLTRDGMRDHLVEHAVRALRRQYPRFKSELHALNVCKRTIHNAGMGLIEYWTRDKRQALHRETDGTFTAVNVPLESVQIAVQPEHEDRLRMDLQGLAALEHRMSPKLRTYIQIAAGHSHPGFSAFIGTDNSEAAASWDYPKYINKLQTYLNVTPDRAAEVMGKLRRALS